MKDLIIKEAQKELTPWIIKINEGNKDGKSLVWFDEMDDIIRKYAIQYGVSEKHIDGNFPEYLSFFEQVVTDHPEMEI